MFKMHLLKCIFGFCFLSMSLDICESVLYCQYESKTLATLDCVPFGSETNNFDIDTLNSFEGVTAEILNIQMSNCIIQSMDIGENTILDNLVRLDLSKNILGSLPEDAFQSLLMLQFLNLSSNMLTVLSPNMFKNLTQLRQVDLSNNILSITESQLFPKSVELLDLSNNYEVNLLAMNQDFIISLRSRMTKLNFNNVVLNSVKYLTLNYMYDYVWDFTIFSYCPHIIQLDLSHNNIKATFENAFSQLNLLNILDLSHNSTAIIHSEAFARNNKLLSLDLSHNVIEELNFSLLKNTELSVLKLNNNKILTLPNNIFDKFINLNYVDLSHNSLSSLQRDIFKFVINMDSLILSFNDINSIDMQSFRYNKKLKILDLSYNNLVSFSHHIIKPLNKLSVLNLEGNRLTAIDPDFFTLDNLIYFKISCNNISSVNIANIDPISMLPRKMYLHGNPWKCSCLNQLITLIEKEMSYEKKHFTDGSSLYCIVNSKTCDGSPLDYKSYQNWKNELIYQKHVCNEPKFLNRL